MSTLQKHLYIMFYFMICMVPCNSFTATNVPAICPKPCRGSIKAKKCTRRQIGHRRILQKWHNKQERTKQIYGVKDPQPKKPKLYIPKPNKMQMSKRQLRFECLREKLFLPGKPHRDKGGWIADLYKDIIMLHYNLISWSSYKTITASFPLFIAARVIDEPLQRKFFDFFDFKNCNQLPGWCHDAAQWGIGVPIVGLGSLAFLSLDEERRTTARIFLLGMPFVVFGKDIIKTVRADFCLRPWHEDFCDDGNRKFGGFPSGHMAEITYTMVLWGKRYGPKLFIPLGLLAGFVGAAFLNCNRHYVSQLVAGAALGTMYALAADKLIDQKLQHKQWQWELSRDGQGNPAMKVCWNF